MFNPLKSTCMQDDRPQLSCKRKSCFSSSILYYMHGVGSGGSILYSYLYNLQDSSRAKVSFGEMVYIVLLLRTIIAQASMYVHNGVKTILNLLNLFTNTCNVTTTLTIRDYLKKRNETRLHKDYCPIVTSTLFLPKD